ncbi:MAG: NAD(+) diphosphatase [Candidatus Promineifilaceae bacterium]
MTESTFIPQVNSPEHQNEPAFWFAFRNGRLLVEIKDHEAILPQTPSLNTMNLQPVRQQHLGLLYGQHCYSAELPDEVEAPDGWTFQGLRRLYGLLPDDLFWMAGRAVQIMAWDRDHQFCSRCATPTETHPSDRAKICPNCGLHSYPRLSPAIIVLIERGDQLLLARSHRHPPDRFSVLAGFVEPGETLEEATAREIYEEVGIRVKNIRYFGSQPWPFPNSLMIAFTCQYASGDIVLEEAEMAEAAWFTADNLPKIPPRLSISRQLIDWFVEKQGKEVTIQDW